MKKIIIPILFVIIITTSIIFSLQLSNNPIKTEDRIVKTSQIQIIPPLDENNPIKIGILHSLSGTMAISERPVVDATLLAVQEINSSGGILGRKVIPIVVDGKSDWDIFAQEAKRLIIEEDVSAVFGGWTSASRKIIKPVFEEYDHLLFYPVQYEGLEQSKNIVYTGSTPNQQVLPAVNWAFNNIGSSFFLVGSDYIFPKSVNEIIKYKIDELNGQIVGEEYRVLGETNFEQVVDKIINSKPDIILNTINGDSNIAFFHELQSRGITSKDIPVISFSIGENEILQLDISQIKGNYAAWSYFQSIDTKINHDFVNAFKNKYGEYRVTSDPMEAAYTGVYIFAKAAEMANSDKPTEIIKYVRGITISSPQGSVGIDPETQHLLKNIRIGKINSDGQFDIILSSEVSIKAIPFPKYQSVEQWNEFLTKSYVEWNGNWENIQ